MSRYINPKLPYSNSRVGLGIRQSSLLPPVTHKYKHDVPKPSIQTNAGLPKPPDTSKKGSGIGKKEFRDKLHNLSLKPVKQGEKLKNISFDL